MPFDITVDGDTVEKDGTITLRERDTTGQVRRVEPCADFGGGGQSLELCSGTRPAGRGTILAAKPALSSQIACKIGVLCNCPLFYWQQFEACKGAFRQ